MKRAYETPMAWAEEFAPNEYVSACITGTIQCAYPGNGLPAKWGGTNGKTDEFDDYNGQESGWYKDSYGMLHGICGNDAKISFNGDTASGYEYVNGKPAANRPISNIRGYEPKVGTYYNVTWTSQVDNSDVYHHIGRLVITNIDNAHPNHS